MLLRFACIASLDPAFSNQFTKKRLLLNLHSVELQFVRQKPVPLFYRDHQIGEHRLDFLVEGKIVVELKAVSRLEDIHFAIGRSYLKAASLERRTAFQFCDDCRLTVKRVLPRAGQDADTLIFLYKFPAFPAFLIHKCLTNLQFQCSTSRSMGSGISFRRVRV